MVTGAAFTFLASRCEPPLPWAPWRCCPAADANRFGHIAMATVITELAAVFANFGFGSILIQRLRITRIQIDTMYWSALGLA